MELLHVVLYFSILTPMCSTQEAKDKNKPPKPHVVVVGGGLAGLTAAFGAHDKGAMVTLIEKSSTLGGVAVHAVNGINACSLEEENIDACTNLFIKETLDYGKFTNNKALVDKLVSDSSQVLSFVNRQTRKKWSNLTKLEGHSVPRTYRFPTEEDDTYKGGRFFMEQMVAKLKTLEGDRLTIKSSTTVESLVIHGSNLVTGVEVATSDGKEVIKSTAVILATGGYGGDMTEESFLQDAAKQRTLKAAISATGDGLRMARKIGAKLSNMDKIQYQAIGFTNMLDPNDLTAYIAPYGLFEEGAILVDSKGQRFVNELESNVHLLERIKKSNPENWAYILIDKNCFSALHGKESLPWREYTKILKKPFEDSDMEVDFKSAIDKYVETAAEGKEDAFGRSSFPCEFNGDIILGKIAPTIYYTIGGLQINTRTEVKKEDDAIIEGLYAAGEVTTGVHGDQMMEGNALLDCIVFGLQAGAEAAAFVPKPQEMDVVDKGTTKTPYSSSGHLLQRIDLNFLLHMVAALILVKML